MKIKNASGNILDVPKKHEATVRQHIIDGNHQAIDAMSAKWGGGVKPRNVMSKNKNGRVFNAGHMQQKMSTNRQPIAQPNFTQSDPVEQQNANQEQQVEQAKAGIHINPKNKGKFNALKKKTGKSTEELTHSKNPLTRKRAVFAQNAKKWHHKENGGLVDQVYNTYKDNPTIIPNHIEHYQYLLNNLGTNSDKDIKSEYQQQLDALLQVQKMLSNPEMKMTRTLTNLPKRAKGGQVSKQVSDANDFKDEAAKKGSINNDPKSQKAMQVIVSALQQGQQPKQILQMLIQSGIPSNVAHHLINQVLTDQFEANQQDQMPQPPKAKLGDEVQGLQQNPGQLPMGQMSFDPQIGQNAINTANYQNIFSKDNSGINDDPVITDGSGKTNSPSGSVLDGSSNSPVRNDALTNSILGRNLARQGRNPNNPFNYYQMPYYAGKAQQGSDALAYNQVDKQALQINGAPQKDIRAENTRITGNKLQIAGGAIGEIMGDSANILGGIATGIKNQRDKIAGQQLMSAQRRDSAPINPYYGDSSQLGNGTRAAYTKFGGKLDYLEDGGISNINNGDGKANVITERNEVTNNGEQVFQEGGDLHSDPSGGNVRSYKPGTVVHSDSIGMKVGDMTAVMTGKGDFPKIKKKAANGTSLGSQDQSPTTLLGDFAAQKIAEKYPNPDKIISYADAAKPFITKDIDKQLGKVEKDATKESKYADNPNETNISQVTSKLNLSTLARKAKQLAAEKAARMAVTGPDGILHNMSETLKQDGSYGPEVQQEAQEQAKPQAKMGKKIKLPTAGNGYPNGMSAKEYATWLDKQGNQNYVGNSNQISTTTATTTGNNNMLPYNFPPKNTSTPPWYGDPGTLKDLMDNYSQNTGHKFQFYPSSADPNKMAGDYQKAIVTENPRILYNLIQNGAIPYDNKAISLYKQHSGDKSETPTEDDVKGFFSRPENANLVLDQFGDKLWGDRGFRMKDMPFNNKADYDKWVGDKNNIQVGGRYYYNTTDPQTGTPTIYRPQHNWKETSAASQKLTDNPVQQFNINPVGSNPSQRGLFQEGLNPWQIAAPIMDLLSAKQPVPYIEDQGAKRALAATTRQRFTDIQPQLNQIQRGLRAQTQYSSPQNASFNAQAASNAYETSNQVYGQKYNADNAIEQRYNDQQNELMMRAGTNKAQALNQLAERTATRDWKDYALRRNAVGEIGNKFDQNILENRSAALYQDMFPNFNYDPVSGTRFSGGVAPRVGLGSSQHQDMMKYLSENGKYDVTANYDANGTPKSYTRKEKGTGVTSVTPSSDGTVKEKFGGKIKGKLPKSVKRLK